MSLIQKGGTWLREHLGLTMPTRASLPTTEDGEQLFTGEEPGVVEGDVTIIQGGEVLGDENPLPSEIIHDSAAVALLNALPIELVIEKKLLDDDNPLPNDEIIRYSGTELMMNVRINDDPDEFASKPFSVEEWSGLRAYISVVSTGTPTHLRILAQFSPDYDGVDLPAATWWDFEEGLWASLGWEDTDTADIIFKNYYLPVAGESWVRFWAIGLGTGANDYFDVILRVRKFRGPHGVAHA